MPETFYLLLLFFQPNNQDAFIHFQPSLDYQKIGFWMVEEEIIPVIQKKLMFYVHEQLGPDHRIIKNWKDYRFQIVGQTPYKGKKEIFINAFCGSILDWVSSPPHSEPFDLRTNLVTVYDGGNCCFEVTMDYITLEFTELYVD